jgi:triphosphatase
MEEPRVAVVRTYRSVPGTHISSRAVHARPVGLHRSMSVEQAFRATVLECLAQVSSNAPAIRARDPDGVHQVRVALRRLQMALNSFGDETPALKALGKRGRAVAAAFGPARELDVFADELLAPVLAKYGDDESFKAFLLALRDARGEAWEGAQAEVHDPEFSAFLHDVAVAAEHGPQARGKIGKESRRALARHWKIARKRGKRVKKGYDERMHRLRIALKKLRYAAEFFAPLYPEKKTARYIKALKVLLGRFGAANDVHGIADTLGHIGHGEELRFAAGAISGWHASREKRLTKKALSGWKEFRKTKPFWA